MGVTTTRVNVADMAGGTGRRAGTGGFARGPGTPQVAGGRRRRVGWVWAGAVVVIVCAVAFALVARGLGERHEVLALARDVPAGQPLTAADVRLVSVSAETEAQLVKASEQGLVLGRVLLAPGVSGVLVQHSMLGGAEAYPPPGRGEVTVPLAPGAGPAVRPGQRVAVIEGPGNAAAPAAATARPAASRVVGTVVAYERTDQGAVVTLLVDVAASRTVVAMTDPHLVVLPPAGNEVP